MADFMALSKMLIDANKKNSAEGYNETATKQEAGTSVIGLLIGIYAAYLSWTCNTAKGVDTVGKVIYAIFAFIFGLFYLIYYALFNKPCGTKQTYYYF